MQVDVLKKGHIFQRAHRLLGRRLVQLLEFGECRVSPAVVDNLDVYKRYC